MESKIPLRELALRGHDRIARVGVLCRAWEGAATGSSLAKWNQISDLRKKEMCLGECLGR